jgi:putative DNA primase/helicase
MQGYVHIYTGNGKGKTMELMKRFIGHDNYSSVALQELETKNFACVDLHNKLANLCGDIDDRALKFSQSFKNLTARDTITADRKFKTMLHFENFAKMVFAANQLPKTTDTSDGFFMRWILLEFPFTFVTQEEYDTTTDAIQLARLKIRDPNIINRIATEEEMNGLLNWALDGLDRLQKQKDFSNSRTADEIKNLWIRKSDSFHAFCIDILEEKFEHEIPKSEIRHAYNEYCKKHKVKPVSDRDIKEELSSIFGAYEGKTMLDDARVHVWVGIDYKPIEDENGKLV